MGNIQTSDRSLLFLVERPLVTDLQQDEVVVVDLTIHDQQIRLDDWEPSRPMLLPLPIEEGIRGTVSAMQKDADDDEPDMRSIGHFMIPAEAASILEEQVCQVFLGLLSDEEIEKMQDESSSAKTAFEGSYAAAKTPGRSKVSLMFAIIESGMQDWNPEDMWSHLRKLQQQPTMRLLRHSHDIITELSLSETKATNEVACNHREFAAKENLYQGFVQCARVQKVAMVERMEMIRSKFAWMLKEGLDGADVSAVFFEWYKLAMGSRYSIAIKRLNMNRNWMKKLFKDGISKDLVYAKLCWEYWKQSFMHDEFKGTCEIQFNVRGVDYDKLMAHHQVAQEFEAAVMEICSAESRQMFLPDDMRMHVSGIGNPAISLGDAVTSLFEFDFLEASERVKKGDEGVVTELQDDGRAHVQFAHARLIMASCQFEKKKKADELLPVDDALVTWRSKSAAEERSHLANEPGVRICGNVKSSKDFFGAQLCATLEKEPSFNSKLLESRLQGVPGIFAACTGPVSVDSLRVGFARSEKGKRVREGMRAALNTLVSRCDVHSCLFEQEFSIRLWQLVVQHTVSSRREAENAATALRVEAENAATALCIERGHRHRQVDALLSRFDVDSCLFDLEFFIRLWQLVVQKAVSDRRTADNFAKARRIERTHRFLQIGNLHHNFEDAKLWGALHVHFLKWFHVCDSDRMKNHRHLQIGNLHHNFEDAKLWGTLHVHFLKWFHVCDSDRMKNRNEAEMSHIRETFVKARRIERTHRFLQIGNLHHNFEDAKLWGSLHVHFLKWFHVCNSDSMKHRRETEMNHIRELFVERLVLDHRAAILLSTFKQWDAHLHYAKLHEKHGVDQQRMQELLSDTKKRSKDDIEKERTNTHAAFDYAFQSWLGGTDHSILLQTFGAWRERAKHLSKEMSLRQSIHSALLMMMEGECRASVQMCFVNWAHDAKVAKEQREADKTTDEIKVHLESLLAQTREKAQELEWKLQATRRRADRAHHVSEHMLNRWINHELYDLLGKVFGQWKHLAYKTVRDKLEEEAQKAMLEKQSKSKLHLLKFIEWMDLDPMSRTKLAAMMTFWHSLSRGRKALDRQAKLEEQLEEAAKAHDLAVLRQKESKSFVVGAMGASSDSTLQLVYLSAWKGYLVQGATKAKLEHQMETSLHRACLAFHTIHQKHTLVLTMKEWHKVVVEIRVELWKAERLAREQREYETHELRESHVLRLWGSDSQEFLLGDALRTWHWSVLHNRQAKEIDTVAGQAEHMRRLHAGPVRKKLFQFFDTDDEALVQAVFYVWKELYADLKFGHHLRKQMMGYRERQTAMGYKAVGVLVNSCSLLQIQCYIRAWQHYITLEVQEKDKAIFSKLKSKSKDAQDYVTMLVMAKALDDAIMALVFPLMFHTWAQVAQAAKDLRFTTRLTYETKQAKTKLQRDVGSLMLLSLVDRNDLRLQMVFRAFWRAVTDARLDRCMAKALHTKQRSVEVQDVVTSIVLSKSLGDSLVSSSLLILNAWSKEVEVTKSCKAQLQLNAKANKYGRMQQRDVARMLLISTFDQDQLRMHIVFSAFLRGVADARAAHGEERVAQLRNVYRSRSLPLGEKLAQATEARDTTQTLMSWKLKMSEDKKDVYAQKYEDSLREREGFAARTESITERLGMHLLVSERQSDDAVADSDQLKACTAELRSEAHKQRVLLEGLEQEMILLEAEFVRVR